MIKVAESGHEQLGSILNNITKRGCEIISVSWRGVPHSRYTIIFEDKNNETRTN